MFYLWYTWFPNQLLVSPLDYLILNLAYCERYSYYRATARRKCLWVCFCHSLYIDLCVWVSVTSLYMCSNWWYSL